ncbi:MAG TPA: hypothetical protein VM029_10475 [Opitutaceae bacterium]|nr:hypothetical protein [Opitutaceae bacterium]
MPSRWLKVIGVVLVSATLGFLWLRRESTPSPAQPPPPDARETKAPISLPGAARPPLARATLASMQADFPIAAPLNAPGSTIARDLDTVRLVLEAWRSNFPRDGNPVGENHEITAALTGDNRLDLVLIPKNHPALNERGELCDRWGTPFRFHQISGDRMEIRSAGPDRKFGTADDVDWTPGGQNGIR